MNLKDVTQTFFIFFAFVLVLGFIVYASQFLLNYNRASALSSISQGLLNVGNDLTLNQDSPQRNWGIQELQLTAKAGISVESDLVNQNKVLFSKNSDISLPIASLTKLMTAIVVLDNYDLSEKIVVSAKANAQAPMVQDIKTGDILPVEELLQIMLIESSNKSAYALAEKIGQEKFIDLMNQKAKLIGLNNTSYSEPTGISDKNYSTARDLVKLEEYVLKNYSKIIDISRIKEANLPNFGKIGNTNQLLGQVPEIIGGKTGFTASAKGCLILVVNNPKANDYLIYVILGSDDRFLEMKNVIDWVNLAYQW